MLRNSSKDPERTKLVLASTEAMLGPRQRDIPLLLSAAWASGGWTARTAVISMLPRFAAIDPALFHRFAV